MAKQTVGPLVRHLEKAVLVITVAILLYFVATYGVMSPNKVGPEENKLGPAELNKEVQVAADNLRNRLLSANPTPSPIPDPMPKLQTASSPLELAEVDTRIYRPVQFGLPVPDDVFTGPVDDRHDLVSVVQLAKPEVAFGRSGVYLAPPVNFGESQSTSTADNTYLQDINWATVSALFDRQQQEKLCLGAGYDPLRVETLFLRVDMQRRNLNPDGTYTEWQNIPSIAYHNRPEYPQPRIYEATTGFNVSESDREKVESFISLISTSESQLRIMRPLFLESAYGDDWLFPKSELFDVRLMDEEYLGETNNDKCRYPECEVGTESEEEDEKAKDLLAKAKTLLEQGELDSALIYAQKAKDKFEKEQSTKDVYECDDLIDQILLAKAEESGKKSPRLAKQLLWAHDASIGSLVGGQSYQYRLRARIYNRYCGTPTLLRNPEDATKVALVGPWSEPSDPITIKRDTVFFLNSSKPKDNEVKIEIFKWVTGEWVDRKFSVTVGDTIGDITKVNTPPDGERNPVNFDTGARIVDIDFKKQYRSRKRGSSKLGPVTETTSIVYVDSTGQLHEQILEFVKNSDAYKDMRAQAWKPRKN